MKQDVILKAEGLSFSYEDERERPALEGLSLEILRGERVAVMGANGSGKSTFFRCCNGLLRPCAGRLLLDGQAYGYDRKSLLKLRSKVGVVFQDPDDQLFAASVAQEISFGPMNLGLPEEEVRRRVDEVIDRLEIGPFRHKPTYALSGGQKKQVAIADVLVMGPELILLDEPSAALDPRHTAIVREIINGLTEAGITAVVSTHDADYALEWADRVILFHRGRVLAQGRPEEIFRERELLDRTSLRKPAVLELYDSLRERKILPAGETPKTPEALQNILLTCLG